jgi:hypothetical protein
MSSDVHYMLINPYVEGSVTKLFKASSPQNAAKDAWMALSKYIAGSMPTFHFTLERVPTGSYHHFKVKETKKGDAIDFVIEPFVSDANSETISEFKSNFEKAKEKGLKKSRHANKKQKGGKKKDDDDDSSSDEDEDYYKDYRKKKIYEDQPILYWWYDPGIYFINSFLVPQCLSPLYPQMECTWSGTLQGYTYKPKVV